MSFLDLIKQRYSVRAYKSDPVEDDKLQQVLEAARWAPSACNRQPYQLIVLKTAEQAADLKRVYHRSWFYSQAPYVIAVCGLTQEAWVRRDGHNYQYVDAAIAMDHLILAATELGLGTCWVAAFDVQAAREVLGLPLNVAPVAFTPLGYPADELGPKNRKNVSDLVRYDRW
jgi:nitroreductase